MSGVHNAVIASVGSNAVALYSILWGNQFRGASQLKRTFGAPTNNLKWKINFGLKLTDNGILQTLFCGDDGTSTNNFILSRTAANKFRIFQSAGGVANLDATTDDVFNDVTAHYNIELVYDSANATATDRIIFKVNGLRRTLTYATGPFAVSTASQANVNGRVHAIGYLFYATAQYCNCIISNFIFSDGTINQDFATYNTTTGTYYPVDPLIGPLIGAGNNDCLLEWKDFSAVTAAAMGKDTSGRANNWTPTGFSITGLTLDRVSDTPTNNCVIMDWKNKTDASALIAGSGRQYTGGNNRMAAATKAINFVPTYWEAKMSAAPGVGQVCIGISTRRDAVAAANDPGFSADTYAWYMPTLAGNRGLWNNSAQIFNVGAAMDETKPYQIAYDPPSGKVFFGFNDVYYSAAGLPTGNPATGANPTLTLTPYTTIWPVFQAAAPNSCWCNFGQQTFSGTQPTGYFKYNTAETPTASFENVKEGFSAELRTGTGAVASITSKLFQPDIVCIKSYPTGTDWNCFDSVRGATNGWVWNTDPNANMYTDANTLTAFNINGYGLGTDAGAKGVNIAAASYVDFAWLKGTKTLIDIVTYVGNGTSQSIGHNLGVVPDMIITKGNTGNNRPTVLAPGLGATQYGYLNMNIAFTAVNAINCWGNNVATVAPTSTTFTVGNSADVNAAGVVYVAYVFASCRGYSKLFSYTGNAAADGPVFDLGFKPRVFFVKDFGAIGGWRWWDSARQIGNGARQSLAPNSGGAQAAENFVEFRGTGIKIITGAGNGTNDATLHLGVGFADEIGKYANAA